VSSAGVMSMITWRSIDRFEVEASWSVDRRIPVAFVDSVEKVCTYGLAEPPWNRLSHGSNEGQDEGFRRRGAVGKHYY